MINLQPTKCNICNGEVEYIKNSKIYGKSYGSGYCYHCKNCGAYVGTNKNKPIQALGILANKEMRDWKTYCHHIFDRLWSGVNVYNKDHKIVKVIKPIMTRTNAYKWLSNLLDIPFRECHFGYFDLKQLKRAYSIMKNNYPKELR